MGYTVKKTLLSLAVLLALPLNAHAFTPELLPAEYDTFTEAAVNGIAESYARSQWYEYGGIILQTSEHKFRISKPLTDTSGDSVSIEHKTDWPDMKVVADFHTHPCNPYSHYPGLFSPTDLASNTFLHWPGIMGDLCTGKVHEFDPGIMRDDDVFIRDGVYATAGRIVGQISIYKLPVVLEDPADFVGLSNTETGEYVKGTQ